MPYLEVNTSVVLTDAEKHDLCEEIGNFVPLFRGKKREFVMMNIADGLYMELGDSTVQKDPCANLEIRIGGIAAFDEKRDFVREVTEVFWKKFGITADRMFINIVEHSSWGAFGDFRDNNILDPTLYD